MRETKKILTSPHTVAPTILLIALTTFMAPGLCLADDKARTAELDRAKVTIDRMAETLRKNPEADWDSLKKKLVPLAESLDSELLSREDLQILDQYVRETGKDLPPQLMRLSRRAGFEQVGIIRSESRICYTYCLGFIQFECGTNRPFGLCFGGWDCYDKWGAHLCLEEAGGDIGNDSSCRSDRDCPRGYGCATWAFKKNECVRKCDSNSDCPSGQRCKKPLGTSFKRCK